MVGYSTFSYGEWKDINGIHFSYRLLSEITKYVWSGGEWIISMVLVHYIDLLVIKCQTAVQRS